MFSRQRSRVAGATLTACLICGSTALMPGSSQSQTNVSQEKTAISPEHLELLKTFVDEFVPITPGRGRYPQFFEMGSAHNEQEQPVHRVTLVDDFSIAKFEVTQNLYSAVMGNNPSRWKGPRNSVEMMTWKEANEFCARATTLLREAKLIEADEMIRLPSEAEWEYCCRGGTSTEYSFGDRPTIDSDEGDKASLLAAYAWHTGNAAGNDPPVGALKPNPWGLYDMHGYLWELTADDWHDSYNNAPADGTAWTSEEAEAEAAHRNSSKTVLRGGSWKDTHPLLRSAARRAFSTAARDDAVGFRCVRARRPPN